MVAQNTAINNASHKEKT